MPIITVPENLWKTFQDFLMLAALSTPDTDKLTPKEKQVLKVIKAILAESKRYVIPDRLRPLKRKKPNEDSTTLKWMELIHPTKKQ